MFGFVRIIVAMIAFGLINANAHAHECKLTGSTNTEITSYNACKNDLMMGLSGHDKASDENIANTDKIIALEVQIQQLQDKLTFLRRRLLDLAKDL